MYIISETADNVNFQSRKRLPETGKHTFFTGYPGIPEKSDRKRALPEGFRKGIRVKSHVLPPVGQGAAAANAAAAAGSP